MQMKCNAARCEQNHIWSKTFSMVSVNFENIHSY
uniref:Uncharacterized protein n=1 Tax=Siphoviridae sp. ctL0q1 TaxID=2825449 RepID=A0A8S5PJ88_9CAUD|nr:MAG TPA: hypothetical protein [Siphoviridae sp. ctL0q1]